MFKRASGILLHITSLPSDYGIGDFGPRAYEFADWLHSAGQSYWQVLPFNPPAIDIPHSPYNCISAFAGNPMLISPESLFRQGLLKSSEIERAAFPESYIDFKKVMPYKMKLLNSAFKRLKSSAVYGQFMCFCDETEWLDDYALFAAMRKHFKRQLWCKWPPELRDRKKEALIAAGKELQNEVLKEKFFQYQFFRQWFALKSYCSEHGIKIIGDIPVYIAYDSADVWSNPHLFKLNKRKRPRVISGVPPDFFNKTGQLWGNPIYDWQLMKKDNYKWWISRFGHNLRLFDVVRVDHFRSFVAYWQVPACHRTAVKGRWVRTPKDSFFKALFNKFPHCPVIVEDLGHITDAVKDFVDKMNLPGMRVLVFGFDGSEKKNIHSISNHIKNSVVYTGTHDTNTVRGWYEDEASAKQKDKVAKSVGKCVTNEDLHLEMVKLAASSKSCLAIFPMQDVLGLSSDARMNTPGTNDNKNWTWRMQTEQINGKLTNDLRQITILSKRINN